MRPSQNPNISAAQVVVLSLFLATATVALMIGLQLDLAATFGGLR